MLFLVAVSPPCVAPVKPASPRPRYSPPCVASREDRFPMAPLHAPMPPLHTRRPPFRTMEAQAYQDIYPVLDAGKVDVLFCGHVHYYKRYVPYDAVTGKADTGSVSADKSTYTNPQYMVNIVTGAPGNREKEVRDGVGCALLALLWSPRSHPPPHALLWVTPLSSLPYALLCSPRTHHPPPLPLPPPHPPTPVQVRPRHACGHL